jgi:EAL domain-containing protein (putative c-di-GMP-specific phosphodiesterase class I)
VPILEETGLIVPAGEWVFREACRQMVQWQREGLPRLTLAVNLSSRQFRQPQLAAQIAAVLAQTGFDAQLLEIELTESMLIEDSEAVLRILHELGGMGVRVAIDDFGTGHSSLSYLKRFDIDTLKIDRAFVRDIPHDAEDCAIVRAVIALAHGLGLKAVAEGVETEAQLDFLASHGCEEAQGFWLSRPLPAPELAAWLRAR